MKIRAHLLFVALVGASLCATSQQPKVDKEPSWVTLREVDLYASGLDDQAESGYVDQVFEKQVHLGEDASYCRISNRILTEAGVQNNSEISIEYDPSYQKLFLHSVHIIRDEEKINKLDLSRVQTIREESERSRFMYNGNMTALLLLDDVRKGDVIEYSYTIKGSNPVLKGKYSYFFTTQFSLPIYNLYYKLIVPADQKVHIKNDRTDIKARTTAGPRETIYEWKLNNIPPVRLQKNLPSWHDPYPAVMVTEYNSWKEVAEWAMELYPYDIELSAGLKKKIEDIRKAYTNDEDRILEAIRFVQDDIRYFGNEQGLNSHKPHHPNQIFQQRYGDCKDKTYLLCLMLHHFGIKAEPVLINTTYKKTIKEWLPSVGAFDHVTARIRFGNQWFWVDPTIAYQRGRLKDLSYPDYQAGLVISQESTELTSIPSNRNSSVEVKEIIDVADMNGKAKMKVVTRYFGSAADDVRARFKENSLYEMQDEYLEFYTAYFEQLSADSLVTSEGADGSFIIKEYYSISGFWETEKHKKRFIISPFVISSFFQRPNEATRQMPYALTFPLKYTEDIEIHLPEEWKDQHSATTVKGTGFHFLSEYSSEGQTVSLHYEYETLKDHIAAFETDGYYKDYEKMYEAASYQLSFDTRLAQLNTGQPFSSSSGFTWSGLFNILYVLLGVCFFLTYFFRRKKV